MNVTYRTYFLMQALLPVVLFIFYWKGAGSGSNLTLAAAVLAAIRLVSLGFRYQKEKLWNKINRQHDQRTRSNAHFAGYMSFWCTLVCLVAGTFLIKNAYIDVQYTQFIAYTVLFGFVLMLVIKDYRNFSQ